MILLPLVAVMYLLYRRRKSASTKCNHPNWPAFEAKMTAAGCSESAINAFRYNFAKLTSGDSLYIAEDDIDPAGDLPSYDDLCEENAELLKETVMLKLNGGLGTGMGLEQAKSLLPVKEGATFLDFIAKQVLHMRTLYGINLAFMLMNSFSTSADTISFLSEYPTLRSDNLPLEFLQNKAPKVTAADYSPALWDKQPAHEWCPPGHGDLYPALVGSGTLDKLLEQGFKYMFVSNSDNLGATMDLKLLTWFATSGAPFAMEVATRTAADKKGGHLARFKRGGRSGQLLLREAAQCLESDEAAFQDIEKHRYFNTNNLWVNLPALKEAFEGAGGLLPLPVMQNSKTVDPRDKASTKVIQLETAMGAAIECFQGAKAINIPRTRFAPVKTTADLLALASDAYEVTDDFRMVLRPERNGVPPTVKLDGRYKFVDALAELTPQGMPSLIHCSKLTVEGDVRFAKGVSFKGDVKVVNAADGPKTLKSGTYKDRTVEL